MRNFFCILLFIILISIITGCGVTPIPVPTISSTPTPALTSVNTATPVLTSTPTSTPIITPSASPKYQVSGRVVDQNNFGVEGVKLTLGSSETTSGINGNYSFTGLVSGTYLLTGIGGADAHYLVESADINVLNSSISKNIPAYRMIGCGVIIQNSGGVQSSSLYQINTALKNTIRKDLINYSSHSGYQTGRISLRSVFQEPLMNYISFILLSWEPVAGASRYKISFLGTDGSLNVLIWDSAAIHSEDPNFSEDDPQAYLDLGSELSGHISARGNYQFRIAGYNNENLVKQLPVIKVSIGMLLGNIPTNLLVSGGQFTWNGVNGASGYKVGIYTDKDLTVPAPVWSNGVTLLGPGVCSILIPALNPGIYYWHVDARAYDETGWAAEITRGLSTYNKQ